MEFADKTYLVTGGSRGIGRAIVHLLAAEGASVAFTYRANAVAAELVEKEMVSAGPGTVQGFQCDSGDLAAVRHLVGQVSKELGPIAGLVNNAGITRDRLLMMMSSEDWDEVIRTNLTGAFNFCRSVIFSMSKRKSGRIVNVGSVSALVGNAGQANYAAAKAGLIGMTKSIAREGAKNGIRANVVAPGFIQTDMLSELPKAAHGQLAQMVPLGRLGEPEEVARLVGFLLGTGGDYITGQVFGIDGGLTI